MDPMPTAPAHAKPAPKDYLWVLAVIAACALIKVSPTWVGIGAAAGFPRFGRMSTDWTLAVIMEAYWGYALYAWLAAAPGVRSRRFAMWSAGGVFILSLAGQSSARLVGVKVMTAFANGMPVIVLALIALLVHLRQLDRADRSEAEEAARSGERARSEEAAEASELAALRAEMDTACANLAEAHADLALTRTELTRTTAKAEAAERKLAAQKPKRIRAQAPAARRTQAPDAAPKATDRTMLPDDFDARTQALELWLANPQISGKDLGAAVGMKERWGQLRKNEFAAAMPAEPRE